MSKNKRFVSLAEYQRMSGLSFPTVKKAISNGEIKAVKTEGGHFRIDTQADKSPETAAIMEKLSGIEKAVQRLCGQFNLTI